MSAEHPVPSADLDMPLTTTERAELTRLRALASSFDDVIFTLDADLRCTGIYGRGLARLGLSAELFLGKRIADIADSEAAALHDAACRRVLAGEDAEYEWPVSLADDDILFLISMSAVRDANGEIVGVAGAGHDITAQKRAELAQQEAELQLQLIMGQSQEGIVLTDEELRIITWNPAMQVITGFPAEQMLGRYLWDVQTEVTLPEHRLPDHADQLRERHLAILRADDANVLPLWYEVSLRRADGTVCETEHTALMTPTARGHRFITFVRDITERKQTQRQLRLWSDMVTDAAWAVMVIDPATNRITMANPATIELFGYSYEELRQLSFDDLLTPEARREHAAAHANSHVGDFGHAERWCLRQDGSSFLAAIDVTRHRDAVGKVLYRILNIHNVTKRRRREQERLQVLERYRAIVDTSPLAIFVLNPTGHVMQWNAAAERIFGWTVAEMFGKRPLYLDAESEADFNENMAHCLAGNRHRGKEIYRRHKDGHMLCLSTASAPLYDSAGNVTAVMAMLDDITERKQTEERLRLWELVFRKAGWGIAVIDHERNCIVAANPAAFAMYGYPSDQLTGKDVRELFAPKGMSDYTATRDTLMRTGEARYETVQMRQDGSTFLASILVTLHHDSDGQVRYRIVNVQDITEPRRLETERLQALERFRAVFDSSPLAINVLDPEGRVELWNVASERTFGWTAEEVIGKPLPFIDEAAQAMFEENLTRNLAGEAILAKEVRRRHKDGHWLDLSLTTAPLYDEQGRIVGVVSTLEDISERLRLEDERLEALQRFEAVFDASPLAIQVLDPEGRVELWNKGAERILGWTAAEVIGNPLPYVDEGTQAAFDDNFARTLAGEGLVAKEVRRRHKDGHWLDLSLTTAPFRDEQGRVVGILGIFENISERLRLEGERLEALQRFQAVFNAAPLAIFSLDTNGVIQLWNPGSERIFGWTADEAIGKTPVALGFLDAERMRKNMTHILAGDSRLGHEVMRRDKDGRDLDLNLYVAPIYDGQNQIVGGIATFEDISARKQAQAQLEQTHARLQLLHEIDQAIISVRPPQEIAAIVLRRLLEATQVERG